MINLRRNTFETNSSSVHTLVWHKTDNSKIIDNTYMEIHGGEYGRFPQEPLTTLTERLNYLWTGIWDLCISYKHENDEWITVIDREELQRWKDMIHIYCPNAILYDIKEEDWYGVDHASNLIPLFKAMEQDISILKDYLLDPVGKIFISGDEYYEEDEPFNRGEIPPIMYYEQIVDCGNNTFGYIKGN